MLCRQIDVLVRKVPLIGAYTMWHPPIKAHVLAPKDEERGASTRPFAAKTVHGPEVPMGALKFRVTGACASPVR